MRFVSPGTQTGTVAGTVTESGSDGDHKTRVAASGWYELKGLGPGDYRETFTPDDNNTEFVSLKLNIPVNGSCAGSGVHLGNVTVSGIRAEGVPFVAQEVIPNFDGTPNGISAWFICEHYDARKRFDARAAAEALRKTLLSAGFPEDGVETLQIRVTSETEIQEGGGRFHFFR